MRLLSIFKNVVIYIVKNNNPSKWIPIFILALFSQIYQRITGSILSRKLFNGKSIFLFPRCNISSLFYYTEIPDKSEVMMLRRYIKSTDVFIDIGANIGAYSIMVSDLTHSIYAFEPHPLNFLRLKLNFVLNGLSEDGMVNLALNDKDSKVYFSNDPNRLAENKIVNSQNNSILVNGTTLDNWLNHMSFKKNVKYVIKIDVEGNELKVLKGGINFFSRPNVKAVIFECFDNQDTINYFRKLNYTVRKISLNNYIAINKK